MDDDTTTTTATTTTTTAGRKNNHNSNSNKGAVDPLDTNALADAVKRGVERLKSQIASLRKGGRDAAAIEELRVTLVKGEAQTQAQTVKLGEVAQVVGRGRVLVVMAGDKKVCGGGVVFFFSLLFLLLFFGFIRRDWRKSVKRKGVGLKPRMLSLSRYHSIGPLLLKLAPKPIVFHAI